MKKADTKERKLFYRRAKWDDQGVQTLEDVLKSAHVKLPALGDRTFELSSGSEIQGAKHKHDHRGLFLDIAYYSPDQPTSTIGKNKKAASATIDSEAAPAGKDYLDGEIFVLVKGNHVLLCPSAVRESIADHYFFSILQKIKHVGAGSLNLDKVVKMSKLKMINTEGVKEIQLGGSLYEASLMELDAKTGTLSTIKAVVANQLQQIFAQDHTLKTIAETENLNVSISISFDGREGRKIHKDPHFGDAGKKRLLEASKKIIREDEDDGFTIVTGNGNKITSGEIRAFETYKIKVLGKSLDHLDAWSKLSEYYDQLKATGALST